jgi:hypothetical protein
MIDIAQGFAQKVEYFSADLCVSLRSLRLKSPFTQRSQRYAENRREKLNVAERLRLLVQSLASGKTERMRRVGIFLSETPFTRSSINARTGFLSVLLFAIPVAISSSMFLRMPK